MNRPLAIIGILIVLINGCKTKKEPNYLYYYWAGTIRLKPDTIYFRQNLVERNDSIFLDCLLKYDLKKAVPPPPMSYQFNLKVPISACQLGGLDGDKMEIVYDTIVTIGKKCFRVMRFFQGNYEDYDNPGTIFLVPGIGIVFVKGLQGSHRLYTNDKRLDSLINLITISVRDM